MSHIKLFSSLYLDTVSIKGKARLTTGLLLHIVGTFYGLLRNNLYSTL